MGMLQYWCRVNRPNFLLCGLNWDDRAILTKFLCAWDFISKVVFTHKRFCGFMHKKTHSRKKAHAGNGTLVTYKL